MLAQLRDKTGALELCWFQSLHWVEKNIHSGRQYQVFGKVSFFNGKPQITHPEIELWTPGLTEGKNLLEPIYPTTEKLKSKGLNGKQIGKLTATLLDMIAPREIQENLPQPVINHLKIIPRFNAYCAIHLPKTKEEYEQSLFRLKFEEFFIAQVRLGLLRLSRHKTSRGAVFEKVGDFFNTFYSRYLPFQLTGAQKRVLKEIRTDTGRGRQMNRLLQGDVGSGRFICRPRPVSVLISFSTRFCAPVS